MVACEEVKTGCRQKRRPNESLRGTTDVSDADTTLRNNKLGSQHQDSKITESRRNSYARGTKPAAGVSRRTSEPTSSVNKRDCSDAESVLTIKKEVINPKAHKKNSSYYAKLASNTKTPDIKNAQSKISEYIQRDKERQRAKKGGDDTEIIVRVNSAHANKAQSTEVGNFKDSLIKPEEQPL